MSTAELRLPVRDGTVLRALHHPAAGAADGIPVLLVHGLASNCRLWDGAASHLAGLGHDVIALDLRGHGRSDKPDHGYSVPEVARDVVDIIEILSATTHRGGARSSSGSHGAATSSSRSPLVTRTR